MVRPGKGTCQYKLRQMAVEAIGVGGVKVFAGDTGSADPDATDNECEVRG